MARARPTVRIPDVAVQPELVTDALNAAGDNVGLPELVRRGLALVAGKSLDDYPPVRPGRPRKRPAPPDGAAA